MNISEWAAELIERHAADLGPETVDVRRRCIARGDGWLAAYDVFRQGADDGWLTEQDLRDALKFARPAAGSRFGAFSRLSPSVERQALDVLAARGLMAA